MTPDRSLWLTSHLLEEERGRTAHQAVNAFAAPARDELLKVGDRLARSSVLVAQQYYRSAPLAWETFGVRGFRTWIDLGEDLLSNEPQVREAAQAYFAVLPSPFGARGIGSFVAWHTLGREVAQTSRKLAVIFFRNTARVLRRADGLDRLREWVRVGLGLYHQQGWQGEFIAQAFFNAAPKAVLDLPPRLYQLWGGVGAALYPKLKDREVLDQLPPGLRRWQEGETELLLQCTISLANNAPKHALQFYRELPLALRETDSTVRTALLRCLLPATKRAAVLVAELAPVLGAVLRQVPAPHRIEALSLVGRVAEPFPETVVAAIRNLPRVYEDASPEHVSEWFRSGLKLCAGNSSAALAYFGLESRTSIQVLHTGSTAVTLEECQGVLRKYVQMLSGIPVSFSGSERFQLLSPIEEFPAENEVALPLRIDLLETHEDNFRLYRFLASHLAGRREFGTYDFVPPVGAVKPEDPPGHSLWTYLKDSERSEILEELFLLVEGYRIHERLCAVYRGLRADGSWAAQRLLDTWCRDDRGAAHNAEVVFAVLLSGSPQACPGWIEPSVVDLVARLVVPLSLPNATVQDSMEIARQLAAALAEPAGRRRTRETDGMFYDPLTGDTFLDPYFYEDRVGEGDEAAPVPAPQEVQPAEKPLDQQLPLTNEENAPGGGMPISPEELQRMLAAGVKMNISQASGEDVEGLGLYITDLIGKIPNEQLDELRKLLGEADPRPGRAARGWMERTDKGPSFYYDEWDYHIADYRSRWCRLQEINLDGDSGEFFSHTLLDNSQLIPEIRRQFQRIRPETYRVVRGLEDGEDFDLNAAIEARIELRARRSPSAKLYTARQREERDIATLFLVDMSASTDEPLQKIAPTATSDEQDNEWTVRAAALRSLRPNRRIIDVTKEALIVMASALEEIGDAYAIYGFSGHGRHSVEVYRVKSFAETLSSAVRGRIGGIEPKRSTRMGAALRHGIEKMAAVTARSKHLFLLSDGFPQDHDYGQDRRSNVYGIRDTAVALREVEAAGITPFCITVDKAGHDYLRQMCDESRYMVIEDIRALPQELPKIYQRVVR